MLRAREQGELLRGEADYQLHWLYLWYEQQPDRALELLRGLDARYPTNPLFLQRIADVRARLLQRSPGAARDSWQTLLDRATAGRVALPQRWPRPGRAWGSPPKQIELAAPRTRDRSARTGDSRAQRRRRTACSRSRSSRAAMRTSAIGDRETRDRGVHIARSKTRRATIRIAFARVRATALARVAIETRDHFSDFFDNSVLFVLDIRNFSTIIYIWYEGGELSHP